MPVLFQYISDYGWHLGRLLLWPMLFVFGSGLTFVIMIASQFDCAIYKWPGAYSLAPPLVVPLLCSLMFARKIRRKLDGEAFVVNLGRLFYRGSTPWLVYRGHRHFRALIMLEAFIWGSPILAQIGVALCPLIAELNRLPTPSHHASTQWAAIQVRDSVARDGIASLAPGDCGWTPRVESAKPRCASSNPLCGSSPGCTCSCTSSPAESCSIGWVAVPSASWR